MSWFNGAFVIISLERETVKLLRPDAEPCAVSLQEGFDYLCKNANALAFVMKGFVSKNPQFRFLEVGYTAIEDNKKFVVSKDKLVMSCLYVFKSCAFWR